MPLPIAASPPAQPEAPAKPAQTEPRLLEPRLLGPVNAAALKPQLPPAPVDSAKQPVIRLVAEELPLPATGNPRSSLPQKQSATNNADDDATMPVLLQLPTPVKLPATAPGTTAENPPVAGQVELRLSGNLSLAALVAYVSERTNTKIIYGPELSKSTITVLAPEKEPVENLLQILNSVLRSQGFALVDDETPGWKRVVSAADLLRSAPITDPQQIPRTMQAGPVTTTIRLNYVEPQSLVAFLNKLFPDQAGTNITVFNTNRLLLVSDYGPSLRRLMRIIELVDRPATEVEYVVFRVKNRTSAPLAEFLKKLLAPAGKAGEGTAVTAAVEIIDEPRSNSIAVVGLPDLVKRARQLLEEFDVSLDQITQIYRLRQISADRMDKIIAGTLPPQDVKRIYESTIEKDTNLLIVRAPREIQQVVQNLIREFDVQLQAAESPIRFYKLKNANAIEVLYTLMALQEVSGTSQVLGSSSPANTPATVPGAAGTPGQPNINVELNLGQGGARPFPYGAGAPFGSQFGGVSPYGMNPGQNPNQPLRLPLVPPGTDVGYGSGNGFATAPGRAQENRLNQLSGVLNTQLGGFGQSATLPGGARVSADIGTNSLIIIAPAATHEMYKKLIESLDRRRPQVLIDAKIIAIDTSDNYSLGVELSFGDRIGAKRLFNFTSFGLSEVNPLNGALTINPGTGYNATLVDPDVADVVVRALAQHRRAKVLSAPRILVNDNTTGELESVVSVPFASVNASQTVSTTSLGGDQQAGTTITVTPHINENDHLLLEYAVEFSTFNSTPTVGATLPPPRTIDRVESTVTIPDGHTVIVGGLKRAKNSDSFDGIPGLENIPIIRELTSLASTADDSTSFFLFIRPVIMRDDRFADLKFYSEKSLHQAGGSSLPQSQPRMMK